LTVHTQVVCTLCGCVCDDLEITTENGKLIKAKGACANSNEKYMNFQQERIQKPTIKVNGQSKEVSLEEALNKAARILASAKYPLLYGWSNSSSEAIRVGIELAEELGGVMDNTASVCHGPGIEAVQEVGEATCTLGEVRDRADLIIYWGCNPTQAHMRHMLRYSTQSKGKYRVGRKDRKSVLIDVRKTLSSRTVDQLIQVKPGKDYELINALRLAIRDEELEEDEVAGVSREKIEELADLMVNCEFGIVFFGLGLTHTDGRDENVASAISLIRDLNLRTKFLIMPMRGHHNVTGANKVLAWQTGYPFAVDFSHGYPRYNPGETSAVDIVNRGECDAALIVASDPVAHMPHQAVKKLSEVPIVLVEPMPSATSLLADVHIPVALVGIECAGTIYRMDGVPLLTRKLIDPPENCRPDVEVLDELLKRVKKLKGAS
jgi:formylmethanofuran dehydrogenase subunit B